MLAGPAECLRSRWRSSPWKWRNDAAPRSRSPKAPSTTRCIKTVQNLDNFHLDLSPKAPSATRHIKTTASGSSKAARSQKAPSTRRCIKTSCAPPNTPGWPAVRKHPAPQSALRQCCGLPSAHCVLGQKAPSTTRCMKAYVGVHRDTACRFSPLSAGISISCLPDPLHVPALERPR